MKTASLIAAASLLALVLFVGCSDETAPVNAPPGHTVNEHGTAHAPGHENPEANCTACHGADLRGGDDGEPSCFSCHGREW
jgi:cytochrome c553